MADDSFHDVGLNGKQLVFLFMAATVGAVVIFLCGIMVGRGIPPQRGEIIAAEPGSALDPTLGALLPPASTTAAPGASPAASENLSYPDRLSGDTPPPETIEEPDPTQPESRITKSGGDKPISGTTPAAGKAASSEKAMSPEKATSSDKTAAADKAAGGKSAAGDAARASGDAAAGATEGVYAVQVAASRERTEAERIAKRLTSKGYHAYVSAPAAGAPRVFRVRVGKFKDRREADAVAGRLEKEEQFRPWVTR